MFINSANAIALYFKRKLVLKVFIALLILKRILILSLKSKIILQLLIALGIHKFQIIL